MQMEHSNNNSAPWGWPSQTGTESKNSATINIMLHTWATCNKGKNIKDMHSERLCEYINNW